MRKYLLFWTITLFLTDVAVAENYYFEYTGLAKEAYEKALSLRFEESRQIINELKVQDPQNLIIYHIENYIDFLVVYISEDEEKFKAFKRDKNQRIDRIKMGDEQSPFYLYIQAAIRLQVGLVRLKYGEYLFAFQDINRAYKLLEKNQSKFPAFIPNLKELGILHAIIGTIPSNYQWGLKLLTGLEGTIQQGKQELSKVLSYAQKNDFLFEKETHILYALLMLMIENNPNESWKFLKNSNLEPGKNPLHCYVLANVAMRSGRNDEAIKLLVNCPKGNGYYPFHYLDYMLGLAKVRRLDDDAAYYLKRYVKDFNGRFYIKAAYQKLAWLALIANDMNGYHYNIEYCLAKGEAITSEDKIAQEEAQEDFIPNPILTKARLLFDGGYYEKAYTVIDDKSEKDFTEERFQLELNYRKGRILHGMKKYEKALLFYQKTISIGEKMPYYYACNAALQIGLIFEIRQDLKNARYYYEKCLDIHPSEYKSSLHQKAKAGLARIG